MKLPCLRSCALALAAFGGALVQGQTPADMSDTDSSSFGERVPGFQLYNISFSAARHSGTEGLGLGGFLATPDNTGTPATVLQTSAAFGWSRQTRSSAVSFDYSPSYMRGFHRSNFSSLNHSLSTAFNRSIGSKWSVANSVRVEVNDFAQLLFAPTRFSTITGVRSTFDQFSSAILTGRTDNPLLLEALGAAPVVSSPETAFAYGGRQLSAAATFRVGFAASGRSSYSVAATAMRSQYLNIENAPSGGGFLIPRTTAGSVSGGWSYSLTPRTTVGLEASGGRTFSIYQNAWISRAGASLGRTLSRKWFVQGSIGVGKITPLRSTFDTSRTVQHELAGSVGYKLYAHTLMASYSRSVSDLYGLGANSTETSGGAWTWKRPGSSFGVTGSFGYSRLIGPVFQNSGAWTANITAGRTLTGNLSLSGGFTFVEFPEFGWAAFRERSQTGVMATVSWSPAARW